MKEKKGLEQEMKCGRVATYVLPFGFLRFFCESVSIFMEPTAGVEPATY